jgi:hypothetical protein
MTKLKVKVEFKVTLRLAVYRKSVGLGAKPFETTIDSFLTAPLRS